MATFYTASILLVVVILASPLTATLDSDDETTTRNIHPFRTVTITGEPTLVGIQRIDDYSKKADKKDKLHEDIRGITDKIVDHFTDGNEKRSNMRWLMKRTSDMLEKIEFRPTRFFFIVLAVMLGGSPAAREAVDDIVEFIGDGAKKFFGFFTDNTLKEKKIILDDHFASHPIHYNYKGKTKRSTVEDTIVDNVADVISELASKMIDVVEEMIF